MHGNRKNGAELMVELLDGHGVQHIFGLCGDTSLPFYDALARLDHGITHVLSRDERHAAYMADAYARVTGKVGVCEGPSGGGATYILPGLVEAQDSSVPVLAITTDVATTAAGRFPLTELDQEALFRPVTKWNRVIPSVELLPRIVRKAFRELTTGRPGSVHLGLPFDVQISETTDDDPDGANPESGFYPSHAVAPDIGAVEAVLDALADARSPVIICGGGVILSGATAELEELASALEIPVCTSVSGQGTLPDAHPLLVGVVGSNGGRPATRRLVDEADCVFFIGCRAGSVTTERWRSPTPGVTVLHLDIDPSTIGANYRTRAAMVCDARLGLQALRDALPSHPIATVAAAKDAGNGIERVASARARKWEGFPVRVADDAIPIRPERVVAELQARLPEDAIICADPGTPCPFFSAWYRWPRAGRHFITNRAHGALGFAIGAAVGAQFGRPEARVVAATGDGSFGMSVGELETICRYALPIKIVVFSNASFGWIKAGQKSGFGKRYFSVDFSRTDHAAVAAAYGIRSWTVSRPGDIGKALEAAMRHDGPALVDLLTEPLEDADAPVSEWVA
ncbi:MAG: thiamine pyrophosphate-binding protein [Paracoccaceae bacterium]|nr:thiamine pyrophosphate-binding protein [Paracoccaceae bacterium]